MSLLAPTPTLSSICEQLNLLSAAEAASAEAAAAEAQARELASLRSSGAANLATLLAAGATATALAPAAKALGEELFFAKVASTNLRRAASAVADSAALRELVADRYAHQVHDLLPPAVLADAEAERAEADRFTAARRAAADAADAARRDAADAARAADLTVIAGALLPDDILVGYRAGEVRSQEVIAAILRTLQAPAAVPSCWHRRDDPASHAEVARVSAAAYRQQKVVAAGLQERAADLAEHCGLAAEVKLSSYARWDSPSSCSSERDDRHVWVADYEVRIGAVLIVLDDIILAEVGE